MMKLAVIVLSYNTKSLLEKCLLSIKKNSEDKKHEIVVVDNASTDGSVEMVKKKFPWVTLIQNNENLGFTAGNNTGLKKIKANYYLLLNSDTEIADGSFEDFLNFAFEEGFGIAGCKLINKDGSFQPNAGDSPTGASLFFWISGLDDYLLMIREVLPSFHRKFPNFYKDGKEVGWVSGTAMLIKGDVLRKIGYLDEKIFMYAEDVEFCMRANKQGYKVGWTDRLVIKHLGGGSSKDPSFKQWLGEFRGLLYIYKKYFGETNRLILKFIIYLFTLMRVVVFFIIGKGEIAKTYAKVLVSL